MATENHGKILDIKAWYAWVMKCCQTLEQRRKFDRPNSSFFGRLFINPSAWHDQRTRPKILAQSDLRNWQLEGAKERRDSNLWTAIGEDGVWGWKEGLWLLWRISRHRRDLTGMAGKKTWTMHKKRIPCGKSLILCEMSTICMLLSFFLLLFYIPTGFMDEYEVRKPITSMDACGYVRHTVRCLAGLLLAHRRAGRGEKRGRNRCLATFTSHYGFAPLDSAGLILYLIHCARSQS